MARLAANMIRRSQHLLLLASYLVIGHRAQEVRDKIEGQQEVLCEGTALTGLHLYLKGDGVPVAAKVQCEGEWGSWVEVDKNAAGSRSTTGASAPARQVGTQCEEGEAVVTLTFAPEESDEPLSAECSTPVASHLRLVPRTTGQCGRGQLAFGVAFARPARRDLDDDSDGDDLPLSLLCRSTLLISTNGDVEQRLGELLDGLKEHFAAAAVSLREFASSDAAAEAFEGLGDRAGPLAAAVRPAGRVTAAVVQLGASGSAVALDAIPPLVAAAVAVAKGGLRLLKQHRHLFVRIYETSRRLTNLLWRLSRKLGGSLKRLLQRKDSGARERHHGQPDDDEDDSDWDAGNFSGDFETGKTNDEPTKTNRFDSYVHFGDESVEVDHLSAGDFDVQEELDAQLAAARAKYGMRA
ncbi:hypothetical protein T492DRAFT_978141 [Pavlovales sp. CCMP2436]|nr:hypothetical protein T492DRAFT_978141 [Pavlovales sp. CCMP2436]